MYPAQTQNIIMILCVSKMNANKDIIPAKYTQSPPATNLLPTRDSRRPRDTANDVTVSESSISYVKNMNTYNYKAKAKGKAATPAGRKLFAPAGTQDMTIEATCGHEAT